MGQFLVLMRGLSPSLLLTIGELFQVAEIVIRAIAIFVMNDIVIILCLYGSSVRNDRGVWLSKY